MFTPLVFLLRPYGIICKKRLTGYLEESALDAHVRISENHTEFGLEEEGIRVYLFSHSHGQYAVRVYVVDDEAEVVLVSSRAANSTVERIWRTIYREVASLAGEGAYSETFSVENIHVHAIFAPDTSLDPEALAIHALHPPQASILDDAAAREELFALMVHMDYAAMLEVIETYMDGQTLLGNDATLMMQAFAQEGIELLNQVDRVTDSFDNSVRFFYPGVTEISEAINVVPHIRLNDGNRPAAPTAHTRLGFMQPNWLFFIRTHLRGNDADHVTVRLHDYFDISRNVLSGGISEFIDTNGLPQFRGLAERNEETPPMIRFSNDDGDYRDHLLTESEISALLTLSRLMRVSDGLNRIFRDHSA